MLGHSDTKMTRHYARVLDKSIMRDMQVVNGKFASKQTLSETPDPTQPKTPTIIQMPSALGHSRTEAIN
jgi:hypothetical protein